MKQRSEEERIAELQAKIDGIRSRAEKKRAKANPAVRQAVVALKAIDKAAAVTDDAAARKALGDAREPLSAWLAQEGLTVSMAVTPPAKPEKRKRNNTAMATA